MGTYIEFISTPTSVNPDTPNINVVPATLDQNRDVMAYQRLDLEVVVYSLSLDANGEITLHIDTAMQNQTDTGAQGFWNSAGSIVLQAPDTNPVWTGAFSVGASTVPLLRYARWRFEATGTGEEGGTALVVLRGVARDRV